MNSDRAKQVVDGQVAGFLADLEWLTNIDSGTGNSAGSARIAEFLRQRLTALGGEVEFRPNSRGTHVIARFKGEGRVRVLLSPHTDTVFEDGEAARRPFRRDGNFAYGPGVGDCKASVVQLVCLMEALHELKVRDYGELVLFFDAEEEMSSAEERAIIEELAREVDVALIMDTARPGWGIVTRRKGSAVYELKVTGIAGHAGNAPQSSASAVMELGHQLSLLYRMASPLPAEPSEYGTEALRQRGTPDHGQFVPEVSINAAIVATSNTKLNRIPDDAWAKVEVRAFAMADLERLDREIQALAGQTVVPGTTVTVTRTRLRGPMEPTPRTAKLTGLYREIVRREYGAEVVEWSAGGLSVGNETARFVPTIDALGVEVEPQREHTAEESVDFGSFGPRTVALIHFLSLLAAQDW